VPHRRVWNFSSLLTIRTAVITLFFYSLLFCFSITADCKVQVIKEGGMNTDRWQTGAEKTMSAEFLYQTSPMRGIDSIKLVWKQTTFFWNCDHLKSMLLYICFLSFTASLLFSTHSSCHMIECKFCLKVCLERSEAKDSVSKKEDYVLFLH
jgi:hypothetical protein